jgi:probable phosphoglycerate mutase
MELAADFGASSIIVRMDSELVVRQLNGEYKIKNENLAVIAERVRELAATFHSCSWEYIPRSENLAADRLANEVLNSAAKGG